MEINWTLKEVKTDWIKPNPNNPKQRNEKGMKRLQKSLDKFGVVFDGICNADGTLIDGHSRLEVNKRKTAMVFVLDRQLTEQEATEMNGIFDLARAGDMDFGQLQVNFESMEIDFDFWELEKSEKHQIKETEIQPYEKTHILISFPPEQMIYIQKHIEEILKVKDIEYEQSSN
jgi:hypothetical protein